MTTALPPGAGRRPSPVPTAPVPAVPLRAAGVLAGAVLAGALVLAGCGAGAIGAPSGPDVAGQGYVSGDGTVSRWDAAGRGEPVALAGTTYQGEQVDVAGWRGDVVVVNFWYAACPPCRAEAPDLAAAATDYAERGVRFLGVNSTDDAGTATAFERTFDVPYPSLDDADARGVAAMQGAVPLRAVPTTVVLDRDGRIAARVLGRVQASTLRGLLDDVLADAA